MIEYRHQKVSEMLVEGATRYSIATSLNVSQATISKDVEYLEANAKEQTKRIVEDKLRHAHRTCTPDTARSTKLESVRLQSLALISQCYQLRDNFMTVVKTIAATTEWIEKRRRMISDQRL
jgi:DeoR/GlpR family transcriptional regulator of sugar metabolism